MDLCNFYWGVNYLFACWTVEIFLSR
jgi:hypothetical protein